ncbi:hypothetical protein [Streptacidiphilus fuscans]|uniref:Uncharacterized protein n=1 Tax=Streptacidiphilus fuscans TaxID=2789292 RepID=A0A931B931_9ACTN|nr:hypothetical protein [Streptacidiphilus fuscans]MBF9071752.1 hypothetical protein [Streptacidiphilus fuscans]
MTHELKAEYEFRAVRTWHIVPEGDSWSLCGSPLAPAARTRPIDEMPHTGGLCRRCQMLHRGVRRREKYGLGGDPLV